MKEKSAVFEEDESGQEEKSQRKEDTGRENFRRGIDGKAGEKGVRE